METKLLACHGTIWDDFPLLRLQMEAVVPRNDLIEIWDKAEDENSILKNSLLIFVLALGDSPRRFIQDLNTPKSF